MGASRIYKTGTPFNAVDLEEVDYSQTADVIYWAHLDYQPQKVTRADHTDWTFADVSFGPTIAAISTLGITVASPNNPAGNFFPIDAKYVVASVSATGQIGRLSNIVTGSNDLTLRGNSNTLAWTADPDAIYYLVYKSENATSYGFAGIAETNSFVDGNGGIEPDYSDGPRVFDDPFTGTGNKPSTVGFHQQRLMFGRTRNKPNGLWGSQVADFENMDRTRPGKADDALSVAIVSERVNSINELASMKSLIALTSDAIFAINGGGEGSAITAQQIVSTRQMGLGSARLKPLVIDTALVFRPSQGSSVRALGYTFEIDGYKSDNVTIFSPHFFDGYDIKSWAFQREPYSCAWAVRDDGKLLCLTWEQEQQVWGWTLCETSGFVEQVAVITEKGMDRCYLTVRRTLGGVENVFIERMALPLLVAEDLVDCCYLDCSVTQKSDTPTATITGLWHLEGETVTAFADGYVIEDLTVANGSVTLQFEASTITVGLPYSGEIETLPLVLAGNSVSRQTIASAVLRVEKTRGIKYGVGGQREVGDIFEVKQRETEELDQPIALATRDYEVKTSAQWSDAATVRVVQDYPLPATITAIFPEPRVTK